MTAVRAPVAFFIFNRPDTTLRVFDRIAAARPSQLFVVADGPRPHREGEMERCAAARAVIDRIDWPCEVRTDYSDVNVGCFSRVVSGLDWVFTQTEEAIILEDDCLPEPTFFAFCDELLERYRWDERIMGISGFNPVSSRRPKAHSYTFPGIFVVWGWATWRRAWRCNDASLAGWRQLHDTGWLEDLIGNAEAAKLWRDILDARVSPTDWSLRWLFSCWEQNGLGIAPTTNLVSNIGFDSRATHMKDGLDFAGLPTAEIAFPLQHPGLVVRDREADNRVLAFMCSLARSGHARSRPLLDRFAHALPVRLQHSLHALSQRLRG